MPQSSLMTWFKKPSAVTDPLPQRVEPLIDDSKTPNPTTLPTPPPDDSSNDEPANNESNPTISQTTPAAFFRLLPELPPNVQLRPCTTADVPLFKRLNSLLLPIPYPETFYRETVTDALTANITLLAFWHDSPPSQPTEKETQKGRLIGAIRCRILPSHLQQQPNATTTATAKEKEERMLYLSTLVLLSPYRRHGIATHLLSIVTARAVREHGVSSVGAHVWEANEEGLEWYAKRGFAEVRREEGYYRKLRPQGAVVVRRVVGVRDLLGGAG
ncbi:hypothetical protein MBLNU230_g7513t1 [Neophaeotheca triangularis]